ncbi:YdaS family helix-turn-helix protein [Porticoccus sp.]
MTPVEALQCVIEASGGQTALAKALASRTGRPVRQQHVWNWLNRDGGIPPAYAPLIEAMCKERGLNIDCSLLCPGFYPPG